MTTNKIFEDENDVKTKLSDFGITDQDILQISKAAQVAINGSVPNDPKNAKGWLGYQMGTRMLRNIFIHKNVCWEKYEDDGVEGIFNPKLGKKIIFQNVDLACDAFHYPKAKSKKGSASVRIVERSGLLFPEWEEEEVTRENADLWYLCVSVTGEFGQELRAELSSPNPLNNNQFSSFSERIFVVNNNLDDPNLSKDEDVQEFDPKVTRK